MWDSYTVVLVSWLLCPVVSTACLIEVLLFNDQIISNYYTNLCFVNFIVTVYIFDRICLFRDNARFPFFESIRLIIKNWSLVCGALIIIGSGTGVLHYFPEKIIGAWLLITPFGLLISHLTAWEALKLLCTKTASKKVLIIGANSLGNELSKKIMEDKFLGIVVEGFCDDRTLERLPEDLQNLVLGSLSDVAGIVSERNIDFVFIALPMTSQQRILDLLEDLGDTTASVYFVPDIYFFDLIQARIDHLKGVPIIAVCDSPFYGVHAAAKRSLDLFLGIAILILLSPVLLIVAIGVKISSPGPIIFSQPRHGLYGNEVVIYKFRSMTVAEDGAKTYSQVTRNDKRVTKFGAFIRKTSLDELPQFINVVQGRMSLVGPRPHVIAVNEYYRREISGYMIRHKVKPGITGWAQVNGYRGGDDLEHMKGRIECDIEYIRNWSIGLDMWIIIKTIKLVLFDKNAY